MNPPDARPSRTGGLVSQVQGELAIDTPRILGDKEPGEPALPITLSDRGGYQRRPALACPDDRDLT